jgi:putative NADH-flavin reductase
MELKNIIIFGASGRVGKRLVEFALADGHRVTAFVRNREKLYSLKDEINLIEGDVRDAQKVIEACKDQEIILSALSGGTPKSDYSVLTIGMKHILEAMNTYSINRILNVAGAGILKDLVYGLRRERPGYPELFKSISAENMKVLDLLNSSNVNWTCVCPPEMPDGIRTGNYRTLVDFLPENGRSISVEDVSDFMIRNLNNPMYYKKRVGIAY